MHNNVSTEEAFSSKKDIAVSFRKSGKKAEKGAVAKNFQQYNMLP